MAKRAQIDQDMLTEEYARIAFLDYRLFFDDQGQLIPVSELNDDAAAALAGLETVMVGSRGQVDYVKKIKTYDKMKALGDLGKYLEFFKEDNSQQSLPVVITHDPGRDEGDKKFPRSLGVI